MNRIYLTVVLVFCAALSAFSQSDNGAIKIVLEDKSTKEPIPFANVVAYRDGVQVGVATTNFEGVALIKPLTPGKYTVKGVYMGYQPAEIKDVVVGEGKTAYVTIPLSNGDGVVLDEIIVIDYQVPLIDPDTKSGATILREDYQNMATKDINSVAATTAGVFQADEGKEVNVRGGRATNTTYFVDGVKVFGTPNLPQQSIEQLNVITGGVPANYGDMTAGAIAISTRGPQSKYFGGVELISSLITDAFDYNSLGFSFGGPLYKKRDSTRRTVLGFFLSGQGNYIKEASPPFVPIYVLDEDELQKLKDKPLTPSSSGTGFVRSSEFVTKDQMYTQKYRPNAAVRSLALSGKIDYQPTENTVLSLGGFFDYSDNHNPSSTSSSPSALNQVFNSVNNSKTSRKVYRGQLSLTQKFGNPNADKEKTQSLLSNSYFKLLGSYEWLQNKTQSDVLKKDFFNYGYIGKFDRTFLDENFAYNYNYVEDYNFGGQAINSYTYSGRRELPVTFTAGTQNPDAALFTSYLIANSDPNDISLNYIQGNNGLLNGMRPGTIYNDLYFNFGTYPAQYTIDNSNFFRVVGSFNTDVKSHALSVGFEFDQRFISRYSILTTAMWTQMRQIANIHTQQLDVTHPILNTEFSGLVPYYYFNYLYDADAQTQFSEKLLEKLGLPKDYTGFVNIDGMDPSTFSMDMFSAEDLLTASETRYAAWNGYKHDGTRTTESKKTTDINTFLTSVDENGRNLFTSGTYKPIYSSVYLMDKFDFKDIKFLVGLRVDRYDANQQVLKDKYALSELAKVSDLGSIENLPAGFTDGVPKGIPSDAAVYVAQSPANGRSPLAITGYRSGDTWYNAAGAQISDPGTIISSEGKPTPLFKDFADYDKKMTVGGFKSYVPEIIPQPRLAFSFPISDVANFFAHYDVLVQRPTQAQLLPMEYYYLQQSSTSPLITNPDQKMQRTVDYELGFAQVLNERKNASLTITSFYKEYRNQINQRMIVGAYPKSYLIYDNIDFSTVKGLSAIFDYRRTGGARINFNYTLQFAEGSGSNVNSGANLATSGQPNLRVLVPLEYDQRHSFVLNYDYRFGKKSDYRGPTFKTKSGKTRNILEDVGFNLTFFLGSGTPYTKWSTAVPTQGGNARSSIDGQINGSSKPWTFRTNLRLDKNIALSWGKEGSENKKAANLNVYLQVLNLFNTKNVIGVYNYTGTPDNDGYLTSTQAQAAISQANSAASFIDLYSIRVNSPTNYNTPRQIRIGLLLEF